MLQRPLQAPVTTHNDQTIKSTKRCLFVRVVCLIAPRRARLGFERLGGTPKTARRSPRILPRKNCVEILDPQHFQNVYNVRMTARGERGCDGDPKFLSHYALDSDAPRFS
jgi:hypothetical protein